MKIQVIGRSSDMSDFYVHEKDCIKQCLENSGSDPTLKEAIKHGNTEKIIREITNYKSTFYKFVSLNEIFGCLIWLFSDIDPILCYKFIEEAV